MNEALATQPAAALTPAAGLARIPTPFHDLDAYVGLPRLAGLVLSPDGSRLITEVSTLNHDRTGYVSALWQVDPNGRYPAQRLTASAKGESGAAFLPDGSVLFRSARPDPLAPSDGTDAVTALWHLPVGSGEAQAVANRPGGIGTVVVARRSGTVAVSSPTLPSATGAADDHAQRSRRKDRKVSAILHESYPVRYWDHDLGPEEPRLLAGTMPLPRTAASPPAAPAPPAAGGAAGSAAPAAAAAAGQPSGEDSDPRWSDPAALGRMELQDLTPRPGRALDEAEFALTPDGGTLITSWATPGFGKERSRLVAVDVRTGEQRVLLDDPAYSYGTPVVSPDGTRVAVTVFRMPTLEEPMDTSLAVLELDSGALTPVAPAWDRWPGTPAWLPDGTALIAPADSDGAAPVFRLDLASGEVVRLTGDHGAYSDVQVSPDGRWVYALRSALDAPPTPVRLEVGVPMQQPQPLPSPAAPVALPGRLTEVTATAEDGTPLRGWLCLPEGASQANPAPLLLWIHGGPHASANAWAWRWNPWLMVARGYAVLDPDFALSTGYGQEFIRRGWGQWGGEPYRDLMAITDATVARPDIDRTRTGAMGGSYGGYMANWIAGHTDRFRGIVTHASLWALDQFGPTTDHYGYWLREMSPEAALANSPHRFVDRIRTPMLVIHGDRDYRVPIGEGIRLWAELSAQAATVDGDGALPHKFLYFPDENHWVLTPEHAKVWYGTVYAFLAATVLGQPWEVPELLR